MNLSVCGSHETTAIQPPPHDVSHNVVANGNSTSRMDSTIDCGTTYERQRHSISGYTVYTTRHSVSLRLSSSQSTHMFPLSLFVSLSLSLSLPIYLSIYLSLVRDFDLDYWNTLLITTTCIHTYIIIH